MPASIVKKWRVLVVDDRHADEIESAINGTEVLSPDSIKVKKCPDFEKAISLLERHRFDLIILDLKDDSVEIESGDTVYPGEQIFEEIRKRRFIPVIFYSAFAERVKHLENPFVRAVHREGVRNLPPAIQEIFSTRLPHLLKHIEEEQMNYMWKALMDDATKFDFNNQDKTEVSYLLARRLANVLESSSIKRFLQNQTPTGDGDGFNNIHPIEMYIYPPPVSRIMMTGDILLNPFGEDSGYWIIITPACDFEQGNVSNVLLAKCDFLSEQPEYTALKAKIQSNASDINVAKGAIKSIAGNNRQKFGNRKFQPERFYYLPATSFIQDLLVDFQNLQHIAFEKLSLNFRRVSLDSPFAEEITSRFSRYYGRVGTPDLDKNIVLDKVMSKINRELNPSADSES